MAQKLQQQLREVGVKLETPPTNKDALIKLLKQAATCLSELDQSPPKSMLESIQPFLDAIVKPELLKHQDREVRLLVATCICEITRITAPEAPYSDDILKDIFQLIVSTFSGLSDTGGPSFGRRVAILQTVARYRSCVVMLDLECDDLVNEMFSTFFAVASENHPDNVLTSMQTIMVVLLEESEEVQEDLLLVLLSVLGPSKKGFSVAARRLAMNVIEQCAGKLEPGIKQLLVSSMSGDGSLNGQDDYHEVIYDIYRCAPHILTGVIPYLTGELLTDQIEIRLKAVKLVGELFALPGSAISETFQPIFSEFLKRLTDRVVEVRMSVLEYVKIYLLLSPLRAEAPQIISALCDRLLDYDENIRKQVVAVVCDVACHALTSIPVEKLKLVAERLRDKSILVKKYTMERLAEIYRHYCISRSDGSVKTDDFDWIPGKILRCFYDKDFRSDVIEPILCGSLFPAEFSIKDKVGNWVRVFSGFDKVEVKALEKILEQKQRLQQEMQRYLSLRKMCQEGDAPDLQKKVLFCFRIMSRCFIDPAMAEENFQILDQLKDANIWKILTGLLDPNTSSFQAYRCRDDLLRILGEKHRLYQFLNTLSMKCSYVLFNKEHVKEILLEAEIQKSAGNRQLTLSCMNVLVILAHFSPLLLSGIEKDLVHLLEDDNEVIKEGVLHVLSKAGGTIREQLGVSSSSLDLILERICLEGSRRQAKYAVHALAAITKDDGLMSLSVLYKRLVDMLEERKHLPAVLQSLGCIAQIAMPVFETRESEIEGLIKNILGSSNEAEDKAKECWNGRSELCSLKISGIKTLVKSYLPVKDAHLRLAVDGLLEILKNILSFGEVSKDIESSSVDKAHLRLAAAKAVLRLSKHWDHKIPIDVFYLTLRISEISFPEAKRLFLNKVHQYLKDRLLDPKYACAFFLDMIGSQHADFEEDKHNLTDIVQMCQLGKARQLSLQCDANSTVVYPEYMLPYLVHALAHHSCPNIEECKDIKAFELIYRQLYLFLSMLMHGDEDSKSETSSKKEEESISLIISIFQSIKRAEDIVDPEKSKNSYAVCDLGLSITKRLAHKQDVLQGSIASVSLPPLLYKQHEKEDGNENLVSEGQTWLADESVLIHFESFKLEANGTVHLENAGDEILNDSEIDGSEVPLAKIIKRLKAKGIKDRVVVKNEFLPAGTKNENDDLLKMARDINLDNVERSSKYESRNGHEYVPRTAKTEQKQEKKKRRVASDSTNVLVTKWRRSSDAQEAYTLSPVKSSLKSSMKPSTDDVPQAGMSSFESTEINEELPIGLEEKNSLQENVVEPAESDSLLSCFWKNSSFSSKQKGKNSDKSDYDETYKAGGTEDLGLKKPYKLVETDIGKAISDSKLSTGPVKKRKRRSIAGLAKCTMKEGGFQTMDLIGYRIKVWWPKDKTFYEGVVKSFDSIKMKHVVLYDDGDVEVLHLEKERWELVDNGRKPIKRLKASKGPPPKALSTEQRKKLSGASQQIKKSIQMSSSKKVRGKRTPRKHLKHGQRGVSNIPEFYEADSRGSLDVSDSGPTALSKADDMYSGDSKGEQIERLKKSSACGEESDEDERSVSKEKVVGGDDNSTGDADESKDEMYNSEWRSRDVASTSSDSMGSNEEISYSEEKQQPDLSRDAFGEEPYREEQSDSQGNEGVTKSSPTDHDKSGNKTSASDDSEETEVSDNEPLSMWKRRVGKSVQGK